MSLNLEDLRARDQNDPLAPFREQFLVAENVIYLDGNSLGALPLAAKQSIGETVDQEWGQDLIKSWNKHGWIHLWRDIANELAPMIGASPNEVAICDSISVNLFKLIAAAKSLRPDRTLLLSDKTNFPTDLYVAQGVADLLGLEFKCLDDPSDYPAAINDDVCLLLMSHVDFKTGLIYDVASIAEQCHAAGALILVDLAHSAGVMPVSLNQAKIDMAVGCGYKYLNGGPGAPAFLYVAEPHIGNVRQPVAGWFGHAAPFDFDAVFRAAPGIEKFLVGTPPVLSMRALETGVKLAASAPMEAVRQKSMKLTQIFMQLFEERLQPFDFKLVSPRNAERRGSQISFAHDQGYAIMQAIIEAGVIGDFRAPDLVRFGMAPLYLRYTDMLEAVERIEAVMRNETWQHPRFSKRAQVT